MANKSDASARHNGGGNDPERSGFNTPKKTYPPWPHKPCSFAWRGTVDRSIVDNTPIYKRDGGMEVARLLLRCIIGAADLIQTTRHISKLSKCNIEDVSCLIEKWEDVIRGHGERVRM